MLWEHRQLTALASIVRTGSLEAAARELHVTPSAVSQRLKALENDAGQILVRRGRPCTATDAGRVLVRLAGQTELLEHEASVELSAGGETGTVRLPIAVNADSLATWFLPVLPAVTAERDVVFDVHKEDEGVSAALLRDGTVMAAVSAEPAPVQGCASIRLGAMRYVPMASRSFCDRYVAADRPIRESLARAPMLNFSRDDSLQRKYVRTLTRRRVDPPTHYIPSSAAFNDSVRNGLGWGLLPEQDIRADDDLVRLGDRHFDVPLFWQHWRLESALLRRLTDEVRETARRSLR